ncbi:MAG: hypothetical protein IPF71_02460 [Rhodoferax sp.]|nr:hypothetical protein [Rhodoferax sp.]
MSRIFFSGVVLPERAPLSVSNVHSQIVGPTGAVYASLSLNIWQSQITVAVESDEPNVFTLRNLVRSETEFVTSVAGFLMGYGCDIEITKAFDESLHQHRSLVSTFQSSLIEQLVETSERLLMPSFRSASAAKPYSYAVALRISLSP